MKITCLLPFLIIGVVFSSHAQYYTNDRGDKHLCGPFDISILSSDTSYSEWFQESYKSYDLPTADISRLHNLENINVEVYLGTWCGDSKRWVPKFTKLWKELGLPDGRVSYTALYNEAERYKQGPNGEEVGKEVHRVPTFIFYDNKVEIGRIVERPINSLFYDVAQIALGYPSKPFYQAAEIVLDELATKSVGQINEELTGLYRKVRSSVRKRSELNTLGYVLHCAGKTKEANVVFHLNTYLFPRDANAYDSFGESLLELGDIENAKTQFEKVLLLDPSNDNARKKLSEINEM